MTFWIIISRNTDTAHQKKLQKWHFRVIHADGWSQNSKYCQIKLKKKS